MIDVKPNTAALFLLISHLSLFLLLFYSYLDVTCLSRDAGSDDDDDDDVAAVT